LMFPDNTVLINFAIINRMDLLGRLANGNGQWCATVAIECSASAKRPELAALGGAGEIFGEPLRPDEAEHQDIGVLRDQLAAPGEPRTQHLGEAETSQSSSGATCRASSRPTTVVLRAWPPSTASRLPALGTC
jgi:hypothetical protein